MIETIEKGISDLQERVVTWIREFIVLLPNLLLAVIFATLGWFLSKYAYKVAHNLLMRASNNRNVADLVGSIVRVMVFALFLFIALGTLGLSEAVTSLLAGAGIIGLAVGFALQDPLTNLFSGVMMSVKELYQKGDLVETNSYLGLIDRITLRTTVIRTLQGQEVAIPNKDVIQGPLVNYTVTRVRRIDLDIGISYGDDLTRAAEIARKAVVDNVEHDMDKGVEVFWTGFGDSSMNGVLRFWQVKTGQKDFLDARSRAIVAIKSAFDREDIMIPFPIRTLDFGIRGGTTISEAMPQGLGSSDSKPST